MTILLALGVAGLALLALSLLFDGILEGIFGGLFGGLLNGFFDGLLSLPVLAGFLSMLGFGGAIVQGTTGAGLAVALAGGGLAGLVVAWLTWRFGRVLMQDRGDPAPRGDDLIGTTGSVVTPIPANGYGEVLLRLAGHTVKYAAKSAAPVARGTEIWVEGTLSTTSVTVRPVERP
ncbi:hypothetical protein OG233_14955 [Streptomyces sp. NBC_01218]|uniref:hypothetical protein n=1 Tax=unclassified Streptomyces TaxID=2593676 RepID=UPI0023B8A2D0|nr:MULTISPECIES: hypothetical protein [unclassified Streptomyces]WEH40633.1 hypothetical protein PZB77_14595 [Streptomyces sp. AM 2-1-1]WSQ52370.1 hypothetical protein OG233_14955 [Streptomyces sp. NBC_01218]